MSTTQGFSAREYVGQNASSPGSLPEVSAEAAGEAPPPILPPSYSLSPSMPGWSAPLYTDATYHPIPKVQVTTAARSTAESVTGCLEMYR